MGNLSSLIEKQECEMRKVISKAVANEALGLMSLQNHVHWNNDGFYGPRSTTELMQFGIPVGEAERAFVVPSNCPYWGDAVVHLGEVTVRPFLRRAWLEIGIESGSRALSFQVVDAAVEDWMGRIICSIGGDVLKLSQAVIHDGITHLTWSVPDDPRMDNLLVVECPSVVTSDIWGRFSIAMTKPIWI